jgi:hypothetical protein
LRFRYHPLAVGAKGGRRREGPAGDRKCPSKPVGGPGREIRPDGTPRGDGERRELRTGRDPTAEKSLVARTRGARTGNRHR